MDKLIRIEEKTYSKLKQNGKYGDTMNSIINDILSKLETYNQILTENSDKN